MFLFYTPQAELILRNSIPVIWHSVSRPDVFLTDFDSNICAISRINPQMPENRALAVFLHIALKRRLRQNCKSSVYLLFTDLYTLYIIYEAAKKQPAGGRIPPRIMKGELQYDQKS